MMWALLMNRTSLAMLFWKIGKDHLGEYNYNDLISDGSVNTHYQFI